jgi:hypothetical protein
MDSIHAAILTKILFVWFGRLGCVLKIVIALLIVNYNPTDWIFEK